ncbi:MAG: hypothetical protein C4540_01825 [Candidatus Omnitrophota bacterium]|jgi:ferredoxin|nr:MAG: hypothetical protein C4540_01825 [Candidatus Omnitrophota bacterium]
METYFLKHQDVFVFYSRIEEEFELYAPIKVEAKPRLLCEHGFSLPTEEYLLRPFSCIQEKSDIVYNEYRCVEPTRTLFVYPKENISGDTPDPRRQGPSKPLAISGLKNCDIFSLKIQDFVFLGGDEVDPFYQARREDALIISGDCPAFKEVCFCRAFAIDPYSQEGFDFNLSPLNDGYLLDVATEKAQRIADSLKNILSLATRGQLAGRAQKREAVVKKLDAHLALHKIPTKGSLKDIVVSGYNSAVWQEQMLTCVECGGCVFICDTCHCFLLADTLSKEGPQRMRIWDGCLYKNFTRVAGGANPLKMRYMRLRNRYLKKFDFFIDNTGTQACCGCGRCIEVCPGKIDIRYILKRLYEEKHLSAH